jgi:hypothetical protein
MEDETQNLIDERISPSESRKNGGEALHKARHAHTAFACTALAAL